MEPAHEEIDERLHGVEVRSRIDGSRVGGDEVAAIDDSHDEPHVSLRRITDGSQPPVLFPSLRASLPFDERSPELARRLIRSTLAGVSPGRPDDIELIVSELVTNALLHGEPPIELSVQGSPAALQIEVRDGSSQPPVIPTDATRRPHGGRGLEIVEHLCDRWGVRSRSDGKVVWACIELPSRR